MYSGVSLSISFIFYNELGLDSLWYTKSILNAIGIVSWNVGAAEIVSGISKRFYQYQPHYLVYLSTGDISSKGRVELAPYFSAVLIATTIHIQDFRDVEGDRIQGRTTLPILFPRLSRFLSGFLVFLWSVVLGLFWRLPIGLITIYILFGMYIGFRIIVLRSESEDKVSLRYYMVCAL